MQSIDLHLNTSAVPSTFNMSEGAHREKHQGGGGGGGGELAQALSPFCEVFVRSFDICLFMLRVLSDGTVLAIHKYVYCRYSRQGMLQ
jgi:hypothetical protein